jgi:transcriptional antiterminator RfaH
MLRHGVSKALLEGNERWFLVHTLPRNERRACFHLQAQSFKIYAPQISRTVRHARQLKNVCVPLFSRYLFVALDLDRDRWLSIQGTFGVASLFISEGRPVPVPRGVVEALMDHPGEANLALFADGLKCGQQVRIARGAFADFVGTLERLDDAGRVRVLLQMMGSVVPITVDRSGLLPAA